MNPSSLNHDHHMQAAIELARKNIAAPFGSLLVDQRTGQTVATGVNRSSLNPTHHGEMVAINAYAETQIGAWHDLTLYTTAEPCCMCQGAILWAGIREVVFGTSIAKLRSMGWRQIDIAASEIAARSWEPGIVFVSGMREAECDQLFQCALLRQNESRG